MTEALWFLHIPVSYVSGWQNQFTHPFNKSLLGTNYVLWPVLTTGPPDSMKTHSLSSRHSLELARTRMDSRGLMFMQGLLCAGAGQDAGFITLLCPHRTCELGILGPLFGRENELREEYLTLSKTGYRLQSVPCARGSILPGQVA